MNPDFKRNKQRLLQAPQKLMNKTFFKFMFSFVAVIAGVLLLILMIGVGSDVQ